MTCSSRDLNSEPAEPSTDTYIFLLTVAPLCPLTHRTVDTQVQLVADGATTSRAVAGVLLVRLDTHVRHLIIRPFPRDDVGEHVHFAPACRLLISFRSLSLLLVAVGREESWRGPLQYRL